MNGNQPKSKEELQQEKIARNVKKAWEIINRNKEKRQNEDK